MTRTIRTPLGARIVELGILAKPTRRMERYTDAVVREMRIATAARVIRCAPSP